MPVARSKPGRGTTPRSGASGPCCGAARREPSAGRRQPADRQGRGDAAGPEDLDEERQPYDALTATTREVLGRLEVADLPLPVLTRALDDIRMSQGAGREAVAVLLERLRLMLDLPWTARAGDRVDIAAVLPRNRGPMTDGVSLRRSHL